MMLKPLRSRRSPEQVARRRERACQRTLCWDSFRATPAQLRAQGYHVSFGPRGIFVIHPGALRYSDGI